MAFIDEIVIYMEAGRGGNGVEKWLHEKYKEFMGPCGGDGGKGGDVYVLGVRDMGILAQYRHEKEFKAGNGEPGGTRSKVGKGGEDYILKVPIGSIVTNQESGRKYYIDEEGQKTKVLSGGNGGYGNEHFKSSRNTTPKETTPGKPGDKANFLIELELIADIGLVGLPNAGKSSLLNTLTNANSKVGDYPFTTLDPHLGVLYGFILADIPGIIEGASDGKGLGHKFLRHIKKTKMLVHLISVENEDVSAAYKQIRHELDSYDKLLSMKKEVVILSKSDLASSNDLAEKRKMLESEGLEVRELSILDDKQVKELSDYLVGVLRSVDLVQ